MQDRFKFRGKRSHDKVWVYGYICPFGAEHIPDGMRIENEYGGWHTIQIDSATIGQCTGLHAAKSYRGESEEDRLIFEGDVIRFYDNPIHEGVKCKCIYADWRSGFLYEFLTGEDKGKFTDMHDTWRKSEIIGTIHDRNEGDE